LAFLDKIKQRISAKSLKDDFLRRKLLIKKVDSGGDIAEYESDEGSFNKGDKEIKAASKDKTTIPVIKEIYEKTKAI